MDIPKDKEIFDLHSSLLWIDEDGIACAVGKRNELPLDIHKKNFEFFKRITGDRKVCLMVDTTYMMPATKEVRDFFNSELSRVTKALAVVSRSALGKMVAAVQMGLRNPAYPIRLFTSEEEARLWLKQFL